MNDFFTDSMIIKGLLWAIVAMGAGVMGLAIYIWKERVKMYEEEKKYQKEVTSSLKSSIRKLCDTVKDHNYRLKNLENLNGET